MTQWSIESPTMKAICHCGHTKGEHSRFASRGCLLVTCSCERFLLPESYKRQQEGMDAWRKKKDERQKSKDEQHRQEMEKRKRERAEASRRAKEARQIKKRVPTPTLSYLDILKKQSSNFVRDNGTIIKIVPKVFKAPVIFKD